MRVIIGLKDRVYFRLTPYGIEVLQKYELSKGEIYDLCEGGYFMTLQKMIEIFGKEIVDHSCMIGNIIEILNGE